MAKPDKSQVPHTNPATNSAAISGAVVYDIPTRAIFAGAGSLVVKLANDTANVTFITVIPSVLPIAVKEVVSAPSGSIALW